MASGVKQAANACASPASAAAINRCSNALNSSEVMLLVPPSRSAVLQRRLAGFLQQLTLHHGEHGAGPQHMAVPDLEVAIRVREPLADARDDHVRLQPVAF